MSGQAGMMGGLNTSAPGGGGMDYTGNPQGGGMPTQSNMAGPQIGYGFNPNTGGPLGGPGIAPMNPGGMFGNLFGDIGNSLGNGFGQIMNQTIPGSGDPINGLISSIFNPVQQGQPLPPGVFKGYPEQGMPGMPPMNPPGNPQDNMMQPQLGGNFGVDFGSPSDPGYNEARALQGLPPIYDTPMGGMQNRLAFQQPPGVQMVGGPVDRPIMNPPTPPAPPTNRYAPPNAPGVRTAQPAPRGIPVQQARTVAPRPAPAPVRAPAPVAQGPQNIFSKYTRQRTRPR